MNMGRLAGARITLIGLLAFAASPGGLCGHAVAGGGPSRPVEFDFEGSLPAGATLARPSSRTDAQGVLIAADSPRWQTMATSAGMRLVAFAPAGTAILGVGVVNGQTWTAIDQTGLPRLTVQTPGVDPVLTLLSPHPSFNSRFGTTKDWGGRRARRFSATARC